ncbi:MAG TPA: hypothetical protein QGG30_05855 [Acidobacteriota bacterium]|jgi:hypothetical protein|nr:hypothetical protein [Opitutales bacterium]MDP6687074.1 hypothetical protein [Acidobacteriota bacterium]HJO29991.1 hypothetical protein [Acidobacteriota bacterium]|tara:strand:+ start:2725 stop:3276 length:552 start_codon:yes stop_codon:yes gene_type:complete
MGAGSEGWAWLGFALMTMVSWGTYGVFLHTGQIAMGDPVNGRYKAFLFVGIAYFFVAVVAPLLVLRLNGATWSFPAKGLTWSLIAGAVGAAGAFFVLMAFGAKGTPTVVMSIVFAGAPIVNAFTAYAFHPPVGGLANVRWQFVFGIILAATGGALVALYKPDSVAPSVPTPMVTAAEQTKVSH